jgi:hypothetical protein
MKKVILFALCFWLLEAKAQITLTPYYASIVNEQYNTTLNGIRFRSGQYQEIGDFKLKHLGHSVGLRLEKELSIHWVFAADLNLSYSLLVGPTVSSFDCCAPRPGTALQKSIFKVQKGGLNFGLIRKQKDLGIGLLLAPKMGFAVFDTSPAEEIFDFGGVAFVSYDIWKLQAFAKVERAVRFDLSGLSPGIKDVAMFTQISVGLGYRFTPKIKL